MQIELECPYEEAAHLRAVRYLLSAELGFDRFPRNAFEILGATRRLAQREYREATSTDRHRLRQVTRVAKEGLAELERKIAGCDARRDEYLAEDCQTGMFYLNLQAEEEMGLAMEIIYLFRSYGDLVDHLLDAIIDDVADFEDGPVSPELIARLGAKEAYEREFRRMTANLGRRNSRSWSVDMDELRSAIEPYFVQSILTPWIFDLAQDDAINGRPLSFLEHDEHGQLFQMLTLPGDAPIAALAINLANADYL